MARAEVRSRRSVVLVVGDGPVGSAVAAGLAARARAGADWEVRSVAEVPVAEPQATVQGADVVVLTAHAADAAADLAAMSGTSAPDRRAAAVAHTQRTVAAAAAVGVRQVVAVTSAMVLGAVPGRPVLTDDAPTVRADGGIVGDLLAVEAVLGRAARRRFPAITVLRPAAVVGPGVDTLVTRHFEAPRLLTVRGATREWQFVHVDDVASAVAVAVERGLTGLLTVGALDVLTPRQVEEAAGMRHIELAAVTAFGTAERLHRVGVLPAPAEELAYTVYPWTVASDGLRAAGWEPSWSSARCLDVLLEHVRGRLTVGGRRVGTRDAAALGAAGAAVALLGTAAIWRQARGRRR